MIDKPIITQFTAQAAAVIRLTIPRSEIQRVMGPAIGEVIQTASAQGIGPVGPVFSRHFKMDPNVFDFEVGVPISGALSPTGRVVAGELPARTVARTIYHGSYEGLGDAWGEFVTWINANGHAAAADFWECYVTGPESSDDSARWRTELNRPLAE